MKLKSYRFSWILFSLIVLSPLTALAQATALYVFNSDLQEFEAAPFGSGATEVFYESTGGNSGTGAMRLELNQSAPWGFVFNDTNVPVTDWSSFQTISFYGRTDTVVSDNTIEIQFVESNGEIWKQDLTFEPTTSFQKVEVNLTPTFGDSIDGGFEVEFGVDWTMDLSSIIAVRFMARPSSATSPSRVSYFIDDVELNATPSAEDSDLVHDFTLRSPNSLDGVVADDAGANTLYFTGITDPRSFVPGIPGGVKESSLVGLMQRRTVDAGPDALSVAGQYWYESLVPDPNPDNLSVDLNSYESIGFFIRVGSTTTTGEAPSVPIIIKSDNPGSNAGFQSKAAAASHVLGGGGLSTEWRWVQIPIVDFIGSADKSAITAIQVSAQSNASGPFEPTGWNVDFWIDDIYLMANDVFPVPPPSNSFEDNFESYTTGGTVDGDTNGTWFKIVGPRDSSTGEVIPDVNVGITGVDTIVGTRSLSIASEISGEDGVSSWFVGARAPVSLDFSKDAFENIGDDEDEYYEYRLGKIIFEAEFRTRVFYKDEQGNNVYLPDLAGFPVEFSIQDTDCKEGSDDCEYAGARRFLVWGKGDGTKRILKKSLAQGEIGVDNAYKGDIDLNWNEEFNIVVVTSSDLTDLVDLNDFAIPAEEGPFTVEVYIDNVSLYIDEQQATPAASVDILAFDSDVPQLGETVQESDKVKMIKFPAEGEATGPVLPGVRYHKENEKVRVAWQAPNLNENNSWWIQVYADNSSNPTVHGLAHSEYTGVSLPLKYSASDGQYGVTTGSGVRRLESTDPGLSDYAWDFEFRSVLNKDALSGSEVGRLKTETALAQTTGPAAASGGERAFWLGLDVPSLVFNGNYATTLVVELVSGPSFASIDTYQVDKVGQVEGVKNILLQGDQTTKPFSVTLLALDAEGLVVGDYNGNGLASLEWKLGETTLQSITDANDVNFINGRAEVWFAEQTETLSVGDVTELTVTSTADALINTSAVIRVVDGSGAADELSFIDRLRSPTGLIASDIGFENHHLYTNALAAFMYMHAGRYADAKIIFDRINPQQHANGTFPNSFRRSGAVLDGATFNGNQAWYLMALTYYAATADGYAGEYDSVMVNLADYLVERQQSLDSNSDPNDDGAIPFDDEDRDPPVKISTEHQTEAYAALNNAHNLGLTSLRDYNYQTAANLVRDFAMRELYVDPYFQTGYNDSTISTDAQTFTNLAFGPIVGATNITGALGYVYDNMQRTGTVNDATYSGTVWFEGDTGIWLEGFAQLGAAYKIIANNTTLANEILDAMDPMQDPSGGFQTFSDGYMSEEDDDTDETLPAVPATAWRYFHIVGFNPYALPE